MASVVRSDAVANEREGPPRAQPIDAQPTSYSELASAATRSAERLKALGVRYRGTRFERYVRFLDEATRRSYPRVIDWKRDQQIQILETEAISQCVQLVSALGLSEHVEPELLKTKLTEIVSGHDVVEDEAVDDHPRNILLELTTASMLTQQGFTVGRTSPRN